MNIFQHFAMWVRQRARSIPVVMFMILSALALLPNPHFGLSPAAAQSDVLVRFTADNAYGFGYGPIGAMESYFGGIESFLARDIFSCAIGVGIEEYTVPGERVDNFLYVVAWSDKAVTQGVIGEFTLGGRTIYTGIGSWQVYATGENYSPRSTGPGPSLESINSHITTANAGAGDPATTSVSWVDATGDGGIGELAFGEANDDSGGRGDFPAMRCMSPFARWMWYNSDPAAFPDPFRGGPRPGGHKEFLIFRLPMSDLQSAPTAFTPSATPSPSPSLTPPGPLFPTAGPTRERESTPTAEPTGPVYLPFLDRWIAP